MENTRMKPRTEPRIIEPRTNIAHILINISIEIRKKRKQIFPCRIILIKFLIKILFV